MCVSVCVCSEYEEHKVQKIEQSNRFISKWSRSKYWDCITGELACAARLAQRIITTVNNFKNGLIPKWPTHLLNSGSEMQNKTQKKTVWWLIIYYLLQEHQSYNNIVQRSQYISKNNILRTLKFYLCMTLTSVGSVKLCARCWRPMFLCWT